MLEEINIENLIYNIRSKQVMLDSDLAKLYGCKSGTNDINRAVKRNMDRFPDDFYFKINSDELKQGKYSKYNPHVFTEQGGAMSHTPSPKGQRQKEIDHVILAILKLSS